MVITMKFHIISSPMDPNISVKPSQNFYDITSEYNICLEFAIRNFKILPRKSRLSVEIERSSEIITTRNTWVILHIYEFDPDYDDSSETTTYEEYLLMTDYYYKDYADYEEYMAIAHDDYEESVRCEQHIRLNFSSCRKVARYLSGFPSKGSGRSCHTTMMIMKTMMRTMTFRRDIIEQLVSHVLPLDVFKHTPLSDDVQKIIARYM